MEASGSGSCSGEAGTSSVPVSAPTLELLGQTERPFGDDNSLCCQDGDAVGAMFAKMEHLNDLISASQDAWALAASIWDRIHWRYALLQRPNAWTLHVVRGHCVTMDGSEVFSQVSGSEFLRSYHVLATSPLVFLELSSRVPRHTVAI